MCTMAMGALDSLEVGITIFDAQCRLVYANPCFYDIYGLNKTRFRKGIRLSALIESGQAATFFSDTSALPDLDTALRALNGGQGLSFEWQLQDQHFISVCFNRLADGGYYGVHRDLTIMRRNEAKIHHMARYDNLTQVANRFYFYETLDAALSTLPLDQGLSLLRLDIANFRSHNDSYGEDSANRLLHDFAQRLQACVGQDGFVARLGGDEFAIIVPNSPQTPDLLSLTYRILEAIKAPFDVDGLEVRLNTSIGIACAPHDGADTIGLMRSAEIALKNAKAEVPGAFRFFESEMDINIQIRRALELRIDEALAQDQFILYYQPLIDLKTGMICGAEALIRWHHPENGIISPAAFIPMAEETGQIEKIGDWVIRRACQDAALWPDDLMIAVNLSPMQFKSPRLALFVTSVLAQTGLKPSRLELEITESVMLSDADDTLEILHALRKLGVKIAMDDFGTGYSSLGYLQKFPFDKIKIDQSFVRNLETHSNSLAIIRTIAQLGENLGITILAEGIETPLQYQLLKAENCPLGQGYLFSKPLPLNDFLQLLRTRFGYGIETEQHLRLA